MHQVIAQPSAGERIAEPAVRSPTCFGRRVQEIPVTTPGAAVCRTSSVRHVVVPASRTGTFPKLGAGPLGADSTRTDQIH